TFRTFGAKNVFILEGGGPTWRNERRHIEAGLVTRNAATFAASFNPKAVVDFDTVGARSSDGTAQIVDARPGPRFHAEVPEPRPGLKSGHIPNSLNVPVGLLSDNGAL